MIGSDSPATVLIADDELHMRLLVERTLKRIGVRTQFAERGDDAVEKVRGGGINLVILDYEMPGMDGVAALREMRRLPGGSDVRAVMLTARGHSDFRAETESLGVDAYFSKPFSPAELARTIDQLLNPAAGC